MSFLFETKSVYDMFCQNFVLFLMVTPTQQLKLKFIQTIYNTVTNFNLTSKYTNVIEIRFIISNTFSLYTTYDMIMHFKTCNHVFLEYQTI